MTNRLRTLWLSVLIGMYAPNRLLPQDASPKDTPQVTAAGVTFAALPDGLSLLVHLPFQWSLRKVILTL